MDTDAEIDRVKEAELLFMEAREMQKACNFEDATTTLFDAMRLLLEHTKATNERTISSTASEDEVWNKLLICDDSVTLDSVVASSTVKQALRDAVLLPLYFPTAYTDGAQPKKAILLSGPNGTGKTMLVKAIASSAWKQLRIPTLCVSVTSIMSKWIGESEAKVESLFNFASRRKPIIIFFDEVDSIFSRKGERDSDTVTRIKNTFLQKMSGMNNLELGVVIIAATNKPYDLDVSFHSRFDKEFCIPLPNSRQRSQILRNRMRNMSHTVLDSHFEQLSELCVNYSGRDLEHVLSHAQDQQFKLIPDSSHFKLGYCGGSRSTLHDVRCTKFGSNAVCSAVPVEPDAIGAVMYPWQELRDVVLPDPITKDDLVKAIRFCNRTVTEDELLSLCIYYEEKKVHSYPDEITETPIHKGWFNRFRNIFL